MEEFMTNLDEIRQQMELLADDELVAILRERDTDQWRPEVFDIVASILYSRGVSPETGVDFEEEAPDETAGLDLVTVANYTYEIDAETDRLALEAKDLKAWIINEHNDNMMATPVQLQVRKEDWTAAMQILDPEAPEVVPSSELPAEIAEPPCPKCGSRKVLEEPEFPEHEEPQLWPDKTWLYHCASCGHKWSESSD
jgi:hypothetical protein